MLCSYSDIHGLKDGIQLLDNKISNTGFPDEEVLLLARAWSRRVERVYAKVFMHGKSIHNIRRIGKVCNCSLRDPRIAVT